MALYTPRDVADASKETLQLTVTVALLAAPKGLEPIDLCVRPKHVPFEPGSDKALAHFYLDPLLNGQAQSQDSFKCSEWSPLGCMHTGRLKKQRNHLLFFVVEMFELWLLSVLF